jgi:penicillin-binding protein 2
MPLKDFYEDKKFVQSRIIVIRVAAILVFLFLLAGLWNLQVLQRSYYKELAEKNQIRAITLVAPRGKILDRNGKIIVDNRPSFTLSLMREHLSSIESSVNLLASGLNLEVDFLKSQVEKHRHQPSYLPIVIKEDLTAGDLAFIESHRLEFPGLDVIRQPRRFYREGQLAARWARGRGGRPGGTPAGPSPLGRPGRPGVRDSADQAPPDQRHQSPARHRVPSGSGR